jgi:hypothetical protein
VIHAKTAGAIHTAKVYTKTESYVGHERNPASWTLIQGPINVESLREPVLTSPPLFENPVAISAGATQAFYVTLTFSNMSYTNGHYEGNVYTSDDNLLFFEGVGKSYEFGSTFRPRIWNGNITYVTVPPT